MEPVKIFRDRKNSPKNKKALWKIMAAYNRSKIGPYKPKAVSFYLKDKAGRIRGGILGHTAYDWFFIDLLCLDEKYRQLTMGSRLLKLMEREVRVLKCHSIYLDTFSFQALGFYKKNGYKVYGTLRDFPKGHSRYFLQKYLHKS